MKLGVGVLGLQEGRSLIIALNRPNLPARYARAVAACDLDPEKFALVRRDFPEVALTTRYEELLARDDVDIVAIYTPDPLHAEHAVRAFEAGKDVICTKPLVNRLEDARRLLEAARATGRRLLVGQSSRFFGSFKRQREAFEAGELGELEFLEAHYLHRMDWYYARSAWTAQGTDWAFLGLSHPIDLARWYLGPIREVHAYGSRSALAREHDLAGFDIYSVNLRAEDGRTARVLGHYGLRELHLARNTVELVLYGSEGTSMGMYPDLEYRYARADGAEVREDLFYRDNVYYFNWRVKGVHYGEFAAYTDHFAGALLSGGDYAPGLTEGIETVCVMEAVRRSAHGGGVVAVAPLMREAGL
jgi:predicted dehydrogenase